jgi:hypothetical protein
VREARFPLPRLRWVYGVDFSGGRYAGRTTWLARCARRSGRGGTPRLRLESLDLLERLSGTAEREPALAHLVERILDSDRALWAIDAPFGLPIEVLDPGTEWSGQIRMVREWTADGYDLGLWALDRAKALGHRGHIRRATDHTSRAPFDPYHYRIIYQTFHGMRDVLAPLAADAETAVLPFHYDRLPGARRVVVEACPSSTLKRLGLPHQNYKQPAGGPLTPLRRRTRRRVVEGIAPLVEIAPADRRRIARDPGGDALDAVIAAAGAAHAWDETDHAAVAGDPRAPREGYLYC